METEWGGGRKVGLVMVLALEIDERERDVLLALARRQG